MDDIPPMDGGMPPMEPQSDMPPMDKTMPPINDENDGQLPPVGENPEPDNVPEAEGSKIEGIFDQLNTEKKAAVISYAESQLDDEPDMDTTQPSIDMPQGNMPMESRRAIGKMVNEIVNEVMADRDKKEDRRKKTMQKTVNKSRNPFCSGR